MFYGPTIVQKTGINIDQIQDKNTLALVLNIPLALVNSIGNLSSVCYVDRLGRRYIFLRTIPCVIVSLLIVSASMYMCIYLDEQWKVLGRYLTMLGLALYLLTFSFGLSGTTWSVNTEIYPLHLVGMANSLAAATNWLCNFIVSSLFLSILNRDSGKVYAFLILAAFALGAWIFVYLMLPETKGLPIA